MTLEFGSRLTGTELNHLKASDPDATGDTIWGALGKRNRQPAGRYCPDVDGLCDRERLFLSLAPSQRLIPAVVAPAAARPRKAAADECSGPTEPVRVKGLAELYSYGAQFGEGPPVNAGETGAWSLGPSMFPLRSPAEFAEDGTRLSAGMIACVVRDEEDAEWCADVRHVMEKADFPAGVADEIEDGCSAITDYFDRMPLSWLAGAAVVDVSSGSQLKFRKSPCASFVLF